MPNEIEIPAYLMQRQDDSADEAFYNMPRFATHIDDATINGITQFYRENLDESHELLDLMSSWISHLPNDIAYRRVTGLGMNQEELDANQRLDVSLVQNLNTNPTLPFDDDSFDTVMIVVSIQYLIRPFEVFAEINRVLKPEGKVIVAMSHRLFPTKAIYAFHAMGPEDRINLVKQYMRQAQMNEIEFIDRSPAGADPLWIVQGKKAVLTE
jgi:SAM-dependent methyltransferase